MLFSSVTFIGFFLPIVLCLYYLIPVRNYRNLILFLSSVLFYAWGEPGFVFLMMFSIAFNYGMGLRIASSESDFQGKMLVGFSVAVNILILFIFKYLGFSCQIINMLLSSLNSPLVDEVNMILPIGISFYTFQEISYIVDVYRNPKMVQKNFLNLGLYITFFPQLIAGPIVRYHDINEQIVARKESYDDVVVGFQRFIVGLAKKVLIANNMALVCDHIYGLEFSEYGTGLAWIAAIAYSLQIYYDFSGYSDMAIGLARMFGFRLLENFNYPYAAKSITDFWRRWHISLTNFFRDYVYIPLGGNRKGEKRTMCNRISVFFLTGVWHGASFGFIWWGLLHGFAMIFERRFSLDSIKSKVISFAYRILTLVVVILLWVLFRNDLPLTLDLVEKMFVPVDGSIGNEIYLVLSSKFFILLAVAVMFSVPWWRSVSIFSSRAFADAASVLKPIVLLLLFVVCLSYLATDTYNPFIYFRF